MADDTPTTASPAAKPPPVPPAKRSSEWITVVVVLALVVIGGGIGYAIYKKGKTAPPKTPQMITISTTNAVKGSMDYYVPRIGTVTPVYTAMMTPRVDGQIVRVAYTEGQMVHTNDLLVEIDPTPYQALLLEAQGQLARDKAMLEGANVDLARYELAYNGTAGHPSNAVPKQTVDDEVALVHQDEGTVKYDAGQVSNAQVQLDYCFVRAPFAGQVGLRLIDPGNVVHAANSNALVVVAQLQPITVVFSPGEDSLPAIQKQLKAGHPMRVEVYNADNTKLMATGKFLTMDNMINVSTRTVAVKAIFDNKDGALFPNSFVNAKLIIDTLTNAVLIPTLAIQHSPQGAFVYEVTNGDTVKIHTVTEGLTDKGMTQVEGLDAGEVVATDNFNKLGDDMKVKVREAAGEEKQGGARAGAPGEKPGGKPEGKPHRQKKDKGQESTS